MSTSVKNFILSYEHYKKEEVYYNLVIESAEAAISKIKEEKPKNNWGFYLYWPENSLLEAKNRLKYIQRSLKGIDELYEYNHKQIESVCTLEFDEYDKYTYNERKRLDKIVDEFKDLALSIRKEDIWKTLTADGKEVSESDAKWLNLLFKAEYNPEYSSVQLISRLDNPKKELKRLASSCNIVVESLPTRVRFVYADDPSQPMENTYVFYWMYGEGEFKEKLATQKNDMELFKITQAMLPLGVGLTDDHGYLIQTTQISGFNNKFHEIDVEKATFEVKPGRVFGGWPNSEIIKVNDFRGMDLKPFIPRYETEVNKYVDAPWNQWLNTTGFEHVLQNYNAIEALGSENKSMPELTAPSRIFHGYVRRGYFNGLKEDVEHDVSLLDENYLKSISSQYFDVDREYGFFNYPVNRGNFKTKDLLELAKGEGAVAWRGKPIAAANEDDQPQAIELHCTLPEWDKRITRKLDKLNAAFAKLNLKVKPHLDNLERINGITVLSEFYHKYPYENRSDGEVKANEKLIGELDKLHKAITERLDNPDDSTSFVSNSDVEEITQAAQELWDMLHNVAFVKELRAYFSAADKNPEGTGGLYQEDGQLNSGPYMQQEPFWGHIIETLGQAYTALANTELKELAEKDVVAALEGMVNSQDVLELVGENHELKEYYTALDDPIFDERMVRIHQESLRDSWEDLETASDKDISTEDAPNIIWEVLTGWKQYAGGVFHNQPGAPSLVQCLIDVYGVALVRRMKKQPKYGFHVKLPVALFLLLGLKDNVEGMNVTASFKGTLALTGYITKNPDNRHENHFKKFRNPQGVRNVKFDKEVFDALEHIYKSVLEKDHKYDPSDSLSERVYSANRKRWYSTLMLVTSWAQIVESIINAPDDMSTSDKWGKTTIAVDVVANVLYTAGVTKTYLGRVGNTNNVLTKGKVGNVLNVLTPERLCHVIAATSAISALSLASKHFQKGEELNGYVQYGQVASLALSQLTFGAAQFKNLAIRRSWNLAANTTGRRLAIGAAACVIGIFGSLLASLIASVVGAGYLIYEVSVITHDFLRTPLYGLVESHISGIDNSRIKFMGEVINPTDLYTSELNPPESNDSYSIIGDLIKTQLLEIFDDEKISWNHLNWRAVIPLYEQGYPVKLIGQLVELKSDLPETFRATHNGTGSRKIVTVEEIIEFFVHLQRNPFDIMPSGRSKGDIAVELRQGNFVPGAEQSEELEIATDEGVTKILSFDHGYFRAASPPNKGVNWDEYKFLDHDLPNAPLSI